MTARTIAGPMALTGDYAAGEDGWTASMNLNLLKLGVIAQLIVKSRVTTLPVGTNGDIYIVPSGAGSHPNEIAVKDNGAWVYFTPFAGMRAWVTDELTAYYWTGSAWATQPAPVDIGTYVAGAPSANEVLLKYVFTRAVTFADEFAGSRAHAGTAATASTVFIVKKNGSSVGTVTFSASGTTGAFVTTGTTVSFAAGDYLELVAPSSPDSTLANISFSFAGTR